jgi:hypothetical protein
MSPIESLDAARERLVAAQHRSIAADVRYRL